MQFTQCSSKSTNKFWHLASKKKKNSTKGSVNRSFNSSINQLLLLYLKNKKNNNKFLKTKQRICQMVLYWCLRKSISLNSRHFLRLFGIAWWAITIRRLCTYGLLEIFWMFLFFLIINLNQKIELNSIEKGFDFIVQIYLIRFWTLQELLINW